MADMEKFKTVPSSMEAERSVLGGIFLKPDCFGDIIEIISPNDFYKVGHRYIFEAMIACYSTGENIDPIVVLN